MTDPRSTWNLESLPDWLQESFRELTKAAEDPQPAGPSPERIEWPLLLEAAVVSAFVPRDLAAGELAGEDRQRAERAVLGFAETTHQAGRRRWSLTPESRTAVLQQAGRDAIHQAIERTTQAGRFGDAVTQALQVCLERPAEVGAAATLTGLEATRVAVSWLSGLQSVSLPKLDDLDRRIVLKRLLAEFHRMVGALPDQVGDQQTRRFFGRDDEMNELRDYVGTVPAGVSWQAATRVFSGFARRFSTWRPLTLWGIGGVGKTTLMAAFMLEHAESAASRYPFAYLDFDRSTVSPRYRERLLAEICTQVSAQFPDIADQLQTIQTEALHLGRQPGGTLDGAVFDQLRALLLRFRNVIDGHLTRIEGRLVQRPFLLVFDTFEIVQYGARDVALLEEFVRGFYAETAPWQRLRLVISGRQAVSEFMGEVEPMQLEGLLVQGAATMLGALAEDAGKRIALEQCQRIVQAVADPGVDGQPRVSPLRVRLLAEEFRKGLEDGSTIAQSLVDELSQPLDPDGRIARLFIDGILIRRVLRHVADERVRALADPGLVVRRFDSQVIREVMIPATPRPGSTDEAPQPWLVDDTEAESIFGAFKKEVSLVERDGAFLRHRPDVRREMLPLIRIKSRRQFDDLHARAFGYFDRQARERPDDLAIAAEALYHALWLKKPMSEWQALWRSDAGFQPRVDPEEFEDGTPQHVFLRAKRSDPLSTGEVQSVPPELAVEWLGRRAAKLLEESQVDHEIDALVAAMGKDFAPLDRTPEVAAPSARLLARSGRWDDASRLTDRQRTAIGDLHLNDAARSVRHFVDGATDVNSARVSLLRTEGTIGAQTRTDHNSLQRLNAAMAAADSLINVELLAYWSLGRPPEESQQSDIRRMIASGCLKIGRDRWLKNPRILRLAVLATGRPEVLLPIQIETMVGLPRDRGLLAVIEPLLQTLAQATGSQEMLRTVLTDLRPSPTPRSYAQLDAWWRRVQAEASSRVLASVDALRTFRELVVFDHSDWIRPLGNAVSRALRHSERDVVRHLLQTGEFANASLLRADGISIVQAIASDGRLLELAAALRDRLSEIGQWSSDTPNNGVGGLATSLLQWHDALLRTVRHRPGATIDVPAVLRDRARKYLEPQPLDASQRHLDALGEELAKQPLQRAQLEGLLRSNDAADRVIGYRQLTRDPDPAFDQVLFSALDAEVKLGTSVRETRPLWNWLEVFHQLVHRGPGVPGEDHRTLLSAIDRILTTLKEHPDIDAGRHCLLSAQSLRDKLVRDIPM